MNGLFVDALFMSISSDLDDTITQARKTDAFIT